MTGMLHAGYMQVMISVMDIMDTSSLTSHSISNVFYSVPLDDCAKVQSDLTSSCSRVRIAEMTQLCAIRRLQQQQQQQSK